MSFIVQQSPTAEADLERLFDFLLDWAETTEDLDQAQAAIDTITTPSGRSRSSNLRSHPTASARRRKALCNED
jgi:plasmid stabilization system protein ParE